MRSSFFHACLFTLVFFISSFPDQSVAEEIKETDLTAQNLPEPLQNSPITIVVFPQSSASELSLQNASDFFIYKQNAIKSNQDSRSANHPLAEIALDAQSRTRGFNEVQPRAILTWKPRKNINVYGSYGIGFRDRSFNSSNGDSINSWFQSSLGGYGDLADTEHFIYNEHDEEMSENIELGIRSTLFNERLAVNASFFNTNIDDNQAIELVAGAPGPIGFVTTIDEAQVQGFETDFNFSATDYLSVFGGVGLLNSETKRYNNKSLPAGMELPESPDTTANFGATLQFPVGAMNLFARADWQYIGETHIHTLQGNEAENFQQASIEGIADQDSANFKRYSYDTISLRFGLQADNWSVIAWGKNITDEKHPKELVPTSEFGSGLNYQTLGDSYGAEVIYEF